MKPRTITGYKQRGGRRAASYSRRSASRRGGFTVIEIVIVMGIAAFIAAITLGGISSIGASNRRTQCQTNLSQIYLAGRLYQADEGRFPLYTPDSTPGAAKEGGLKWLYAPLGVMPGSTVLGAYLKSAKTLHCPEDNAIGHTNLLESTGAAFNPDYFSYQTEDAASDGVLTSYQTYLPIRTKDTTDPLWPRQLLPWDGSGTVTSLRPPADNTVVTWCFWHRTVMGGRNYDNVLFYDGSVQLIPRKQEDPDGGGAILTGWSRKPRAGY